MRDPERIERMLEKVRTIWNRSPDLRLLQLLINAQQSSYHGGLDSYSVEDHAVEEGLDWLIKHVK